MDAPNDHPLQALLAQKFFKYFTAKYNSGTLRIGRYFFEGVINTHYFGKLVTKLKTIENSYKNEDDDQSKETYYKMFKAYGHWLEDMCILDETLHVPSLPPNMMPELVTEVFSPNKRLSFDIIDFGEIESSSLDYANEWKRLHFRLNKIPTELSPTAPQSTVFKILNYDSPLPLPASNPSQLLGIELSDTWFTNEAAFLSSVQPQINALLSHAKQYDDQRREYGSLLYSIMDLVSGLYINEDSELWTKGSCLGTAGPKGQKFECAGSAAICHKFCQAKLQSHVELRLAEHRNARTALVQDVSQPIQLGVIIASSLLDCIVEHLMKMYFRHLSLHSKGKGSSSTSLMHYHQLGIRLFYILCDCLGEETNACPLMRHLLTSSLEKLGQAMVSDNPNECLPLLQRIVAQPEFAHFLTSVFTPSCATTEVFFQMYKCIGDLPDNHSSMTFTLLSKMSVESWCAKNPQSKSVSRLLSSVGENLKRSGPEVNAGRLLIHDLHRSHLITLAKHNFPAHYDETICLLLVLTEANCLDPQLWLDLVNMYLPNGQTMNLKSTTRQLVDSANNLLFYDNLLMDMEEIEVSYQLITDHFNKERRSVGLHGLYSKYRKYAQPLAMFMGLNCCLCIELKKRQGGLHETAKPLFDWIFGLFEAWILPLMEGQRQETAAWIQQFAESSKVLFPWAPGDVASAETVLSVFTGCLNYLDTIVLDSTPHTRGVTPCLLEVYCHRYAKPTIKDFVLNPVHNQWLGLSWTQMIPQPQDLNLIVTVMDTFIPLCHEFLGKVFVQLPWKQTFTTDSLTEQTKLHLAPYLLHIVVKLSAGN